MTTPRTRRTPQQQAIDLLSKLLVRQRALVGKLQGDYVAAQIAAAKTDRAIEALSMERLPGMQEEALAEEATTRRAIEALKMERLRGMGGEPIGVRPIGADTSSTAMLGPTLTGVVMTEAEVEVARLMAEAEARETPPSVLTNSAPRQYRQRIGEKAEDSLTCPECNHELPWHYDGCTVLAARLKEGV